MTPNVIDAMADVFSRLELEKGELPSYAGLISAVENDPKFKQAAAGASLSAYKQDIYSRTRQNQGGFNVESFNGWYERTNNEISQAIDLANSKFDEIKAMPDPNKRLGSLKRLQREFDGALVSASQEIEARRQRADRWVEYGTGGWNEELVTGPSGTALNNVIARNRENFQGQVAEIAAQAERDGAQAGEGAPNEPNRSGSSAATPIARAWEDMRSEAARSTAIESRAMKYETAGNWMGAFTTQSAQERADAQAFREFFNESGAPGMRRKLMKNPADYNLFMKDPIAYMKQYENGKWYETYKNPGKKN